MPGAAETARLIASLELKDKMSPGIKSATSSIDKLDKGFYRTGRGIGKLGKAAGTAGLLAGGAIAAGLAGAAKAAIDYGDAFAGVAKTVDEADLAKSGLSLEDLSNSIRQMSRDMPNSAIELAGIAESAGALGVKAKDIESFTKQVAILASTTNVSADDAATALGQLQNVIGLTGGEFDNFTAALVDLGNKGASTESDILEIERRSGGAAKLFGIAKAATLGWAAAAANLGLNSELAGTSLQNVFLKLMPKVSKGSKTLSTVMGKSAAGVKKAFAKDASGALEAFITKLGKMPKDARLAAVQKIFGKGAGITRLILGLAESIKTNLNPALDTSTQAWKDATAAQVEFDKRNATVKSAFSRLKNNILDAAVTLGEGFAPALGRAADKLSKFLGQEGNRNKLKSIGEDIGKAIDSIDFDRLLTTAQDLVAALRPAAGIILKIGEAISKLPPELLGAGGALVVTNKVTGGLVLSAAGDIFGGLGKALAVGLASNVPLFGKAFVQPVFVTNLGGLPGGGGGTPVPTPGLTVPLTGAVVALDAESRSTLDKNAHAFGVAVTQNGKDNRSFIEKFLHPLDNPNGNPGGALTGGAPGKGGPNGKGTSPMKGWAEAQRAWVDNGKKITDLQHAAIPAIDAQGAAIVTAQSDTKREVAAKVAAGATTTANAATGAGSRVTSQSIANTGRITGAIYAAQPTVITNVYVSGASVTKSQTVTRRGGRASSRSDDNVNDHR